jgi:hypothetical protein
MYRFGCVVFLLIVLICIYLAVTSGYLAYELQQPSGAPASSVIGTPSLRPSFVDRVLSRAHSPAQGTGQALYDLSKTYHIDDAYALAFFEHESAFGTTGMARVTHSLGNIRCSQGYVCINGYRAYGNWVAGYRDWFHLIAVLYIKQWHLTTVEKIIPVYAPPSDGNNVRGYIAAVERAVDDWRQGKV